MKPRTLARLFIVAALASATAGCVLFPSARDRAVRNSPSFKDGYGDGCAAATTESSNYREGPYRDEALYKSDSAYRAGWADGYQTCKPVQQNGTQYPGGNPIGGGPPH
jgi:hypothetical protein